MYDTKTLEFDKVLENLSNYAKTSYAKKLILETELNNSYDKIVKEKNYTKKMTKLLLVVKRKGQIGILN